ncbi:MAG: CAP domain-containing protein [Gemmatimonadota bacterium]
MRRAWPPRRTWPLWTVLLVALLPGAGCVGYRIREASDPEAVLTPPAAPLAADDPTAIATEILRQVNRARSAVGARPLAAEPALDTAAREYAAELAERGAIGHSSATPGRRTLRERLRAAGANHRRSGENLALMQSTASQLPVRVVRGWLRSPGHRANLLDARFRYSGLGVARDGRGRWFVVQVYGGE